MMHKDTGCDVLYGERDYSVEHLNLFELCATLRMWYVFLMNVIDLCEMFRSGAACNQTNQLHCGCVLELLYGEKGYDDMFNQSIERIKDVRVEYWAAVADDPANKEKEST